MRHNVIILTSGLTGSSVLTGLIARGGYWTGSSTQKKEDYDTFENKELIELNLRLFQNVDYRGNYLLEFSPDVMRQIESFKSNGAEDSYRAFVNRCNEHRPWVWKDPRLWLTIRFWKNLLDLEDCRFILLTRDFRQSWISATLRRQIKTYRAFKQYETSVENSIVKFCENAKVPYLHVRYEDLIRNPVEVIGRLNGWLDTTLTVDDLKKTYHKPLYKTPRSSYWNQAKALLIYLKNYSRRLDVAGERIVTTPE